MKSNIEMFLVWSYVGIIYKYMENVATATKRIDWVDIYKSFAIILMVLGHATGIFNPLIYQFHMAAFFFISGYTAKLENKSFVEVFINKFFTILLPLFFIATIGIFSNIIITSYDAYDKVFDLPYMGYDAFRLFFNDGSLYVQWMGACWFLPVIFGIFLLHRVLVKCSGEKANLFYLLLAFVLNWLGYLFIKNSIRVNISILPIDLILIGQFYFALGNFMAHIKKPKFIENAGYSLILFEILGLIATLLIMYLIKDKPSVSVGYPDRYFPNLFVNLFASVNGIIFLYCLSKLVELIPHKFRAWFSYIGKNTLGILMFHFLFFKFFFLILAANGLITPEQVLPSVPTYELNNSLYPLLTISSIGLSLLLYFILTIIPGVKFLMGSDKKIYKAISAKINDYINSLKEKIKILLSKI